MPDLVDSVGAGLASAKQGAMARAEIELMKQQTETAETLSNLQRQQQMESFQREQLGVEQQRQTVANTALTLEQARTERQRTQTEEANTALTILRGLSEAELARLHSATAALRRSEAQSHQQFGTHSWGRLLDSLRRSAETGLREGQSLYNRFGGPR